jgi:hypothetical protein
MLTADAGSVQVPSLPTLTSCDYSPPQVNYKPLTPHLKEVMMTSGASGAKWLRRQRLALAAHAEAGLRLGSPREAPEPRHLSVAVTPGTILKSGRM